MDTLVNALNALTPLGLAAGLAYIIYQLVAKKGAVRAISTNHLSGLPEMHATLLRLEALLKDINDNVIYVKARVDGHGER